MHSAITSFNGISNIGLFAFANDKFVLLGKEVPEPEGHKIRDALKVPVHRITIAGTSLIGVFVAGNNEKILVPAIIFDHEKEELDRLGIHYSVLDTKMTCLGNNISVNNGNALVNPEFTEAQAKEIESLLGVRTYRTRIAGMNTVGSVIAVAQQSSKALVPNIISEQELELIEDRLGVSATTGTVNMGSPHIRAGIICNSSGFIIGKESGGPEITNADEALGFMEE